VLIGQPAEEIGLGALAMLSDGLYTRFPKPDSVVSFHTWGGEPAGMVTYASGWAYANVDSVDITVKGVGTHGSTPHLGKDPIVLSAEIINALQTLVSREVDAQEAGVVTVGSIQAGYKHNIIPDEAKLKITVRSYTDEVRKQLLDGIKRIVRAQAESAGLPESLMPVVEVESDATPALYNDPALTDRAMAAVRKALGDDRVATMRPVMGGEDFSRFGLTDDDIPVVDFWVGGADPRAIADAKAGKKAKPPSNHSPQFAPVVEPTLKTGVESLTAVALDLLKAP
jgi:hippurate hydrolase